MLYIVRIQLTKGFCYWSYKLDGSLTSAVEDAAKFDLVTATCLANKLIKLHPSYTIECIAV